MFEFKHLNYLILNDRIDFLVGSPLVFIFQKLKMMRALVNKSSRQEIKELYPFLLKTGDFD